MAPGKGSADWAAYPEDLTHLLDFLNWPPKKGGPKTANSIATKWKGTRKLYDQILQAKQKAYPGALGWTYSDDLGFNVTDDTRDAWSNFVKAHPHFKPFTTRGWPHFTTVDEPSQPSQGNDDDEDSSQPFSDWSQSNFGESQSPDPTNSVPASQSTASRAPASIHSHTPKTTGPESILALGRSVDGMGKVISTVFTPPPKFSAMSPTKKVETARKLALEDMHGGYIMSDERTWLNILFGRDTSAADAYILDNDPFLRAETGRELLNQLNPTPNFNFH
ncbi:hypothetical protein B0H17DRAFT_1206578 [Mycena rosella]|uniref:Myb/SANT-like domain-containing protein n=1 Tax=Mycena rosella TaxID=1033263 RepID=A0AAD7D520_MYCRO|nr:hypothetical protein B0H17DRAFT_1206578 [Mycena rosella]